MTPIPSITDDVLKEIEALCKKATQGQWWIDSHGHAVIVPESGKTVFMTDSRMGEAVRNPETGNLSHWPNDWDASYIATACPENVHSLIRRLRESEARLWSMCVAVTQKDVERVKRETCNNLEYLSSHATGEKK